MPLDLAAHSTGLEPTVTEFFESLRIDIDQQISDFTEKSPHATYDAVCEIHRLCEDLSSSWVCPKIRAELRHITHVDCSSTAGPSDKNVAVPAPVISYTDRGCQTEALAVAIPEAYGIQHRGETHPSSHAGAVESPDIVLPDDLISHIPDPPTTGPNAASTNSKVPRISTKRKQENLPTLNPWPDNEIVRILLPVQRLLPSTDTLTTPRQIFNDLIQALPSCPSTTISLLLRLFYAIGSPSSLTQLRDVCVSLRQKHLHIPYPTTPHKEKVSEVMEALDHLDITTCAAYILRRYHLVHLVQLRDERQNHHRSLSTEPSVRMLKYGHVKEMRRRPGEGSGRAASLALKDLVLESVPKLKLVPEQDLIRNTEWQKAHGSLKRRLTHGRNWRSLVQRFEMGILAVVPVAGDFGVFNHEVESLPKETFEVFLDVLERYHGLFVRSLGHMMSQHIFEILMRGDLRWTCCFESLGDVGLQSAPYDLEALMRACIAS